MRNARAAALGYLCSIPLVLSGCAVTGHSQDAGGAPKVVVANRAEARWNALIDGDVEKAYGYLSPATRQAITLKSYRGRVNPGIWTGVRVKSVDCTDQLCTVVVTIKYNLGTLKGLEKDLEEAWIQDQGNWWFVQKK